jgi:hypothetical protein
LDATCSGLDHEDIKGRIVEHACEVLVKNRPARSDVKNANRMIVVSAAPAAGIVVRGGLKRAAGEQEQPLTQDEPTALDEARVLARYFGDGNASRGGSEMEAEACCEMVFARAAARQTYSQTTAIRGYLGTLESAEQRHLSAAGFASILALLAEAEEEFGISRCVAGSKGTFSCQYSETCQQRKRPVGGDSSAGFSYFRH